MGVSIKFGTGNSIIVKNTLSQYLKIGLEAIKSKFTSYTKTLF